MIIGHAQTIHDPEVNETITKHIDIHEENKEQVAQVLEVVKEETGSVSPMQQAVTVDVLIDSDIKKEVLNEFETKKGESVDSDIKKDVSVGSEIKKE